MLALVAISCFKRKVSTEEEASLYFAICFLLSFVGYELMVVVDNIPALNKLQAKKAMRVALLVLY